MPLRSPNNLNTSKVIMTLLKSIMLPNTQLAATSASGTGTELTFIQQRYRMALNMIETDIPIAVNMTSGEQERTQEAQRAYAGTIAIDVAYYSRWSGEVQDLDALWASLDEDIERICANIESNDATEYGGANHTIGLEKITFSPYEGQFDDSITSLTLIKRVLTLTYNILPYGT